MSDYVCRFLNQKKKQFTANKIVTPKTQSNEKLNFIAIIICAQVIISGLFNKSAAQFFGQFIYRHDSTFLTSAQRTVIDPGWVMGGFRPVVHSGKAHVVVDKVDNLGMFSTGLDFSNEYEIQDADVVSCFPTIPVPLCQGITVIETANTMAGNGYALAAAFADPNGGNDYRGVFYASLDAAGNVINYYRWNLPGGSYAPTFKKPVIIESTVNPGNYYICGHYNNQTYIHKITSNATPVWSWWYSFSADLSAFESSSLHTIPLAVSWSLWEGLKIIQSARKGL